MRVFPRRLLLPRQEQSLDLLLPVSLRTFHLFSEFSVNHPPSHSSPKPPASGPGHPRQCPLSLPLQIQFFAHSRLLSSGHLYWIGRQEKFPRQKRIGNVVQVIFFVCFVCSGRKKNVGKSVYKSFYLGQGFQGLGGSY